jgi:predicted NBD/HSP70 family sugar kinase/biotin operon repressor
VLATILHEGPVSRPQIAQRTGLSKATVGAAVDRLEQAGLIQATGPRHGMRGRSPIAYVTHDSSGFVIGVDIGGANMRAAAADVYGETICEEHQPTGRSGARAVSLQAATLAGKVADRARSTHSGLLAIGISTPGIVDEESSRVTSLAYNVSPDGGLDPRALLAARFDVPVVIDNNVNLAAIAESWQGLARGIHTFVFIAVGAGVGMGLVIGDQLVRGAHGAAGEIGYIPSHRDPFDERHRLHGGLEDEIGAGGILAAYRAREGSGEPASAEEVFDLARGGDPDAGAVVEHTARRLGTAIASVIAVIDPELVVLGGGIGCNPVLLAPARATVAELVPLSARIECSRLGERAALLGAIALALREARTRLLSRATR